MAPTFTALLFLGLSLDFRTPVLAGSLPKPLVRVEPGSVVTKGSQVTISCEGTSMAMKYHLLKQGKSEPWRSQIPKELVNKAEFPIQSIEWHDGGLYSCAYETSAGWAVYSDPLELVVTGVYYSKPRLSALHSPAVASGGNIILQCVSEQRYDRFVLKKEGPQELSWTQNPRYVNYTGEYQAMFSVGPVTPSQRWNLRCYSYDLIYPQIWSEPSDPLELLVSKTLHKPTLWAEPRSVITSGNPVTIWCQGNLDVQIYVLHKEGSTAPWDTQTPLDTGNKAKFSIPSMTETYAGRYCCYYYSPAGWTQCSDTLELVMTVYNSRPQLSVLPSPVVTTEENVTLQCVSSHGYDRFILTWEGREKNSSFQDSQYLNSTGHVQALFTVGPVTPSRRGPFRCYGYYKRNPQVWSESSIPLEIHVSGISETINSSENMSNPKTGISETMNISHIMSNPKTGTSETINPSQNMSNPKTGISGTINPSQNMSNPKTGISETINPSQNMSNPKTASQSQNHTIENLIRMGVAGLVLVILVILLLEAQHSQRMTKDAPRKCTGDRSSPFMETEFGNQI